MTTAARSPIRLRAYVNLGTTDEVTTCECCGRSDLKTTVQIMPLDADGNHAADAPVYYGTTCAARALKLTVRDVRRETRQADRERQEAAQRARREAEHARRQAFARFLQEHSPVDTWTNIDRQLYHAAQRLGLDIDATETRGDRLEPGLERARIWRILEDLAVRAG